MAKIYTTISKVINDSGKSEILFRVNVSKINQPRIKSGIFVYPERFADGAITAQRAEDREGRRKEMLDASEKLGYLKIHINSLCEQNKDITKETLAIEVDKFHNPEKYIESADKETTIVERLEAYITQSYDNGVFGEGRKRHYDVLHRELNRFSIINGLQHMKAGEFTADTLVQFKDFLTNEHKYVSKYKYLYSSKRYNTTPTKPRSQNTVSNKMKELQAFFTELEGQDEIEISPFRKVGKARKKAIMRSQYDEPIFLTKEEFITIQNTEVPANLQGAKDAFMLQCALGCRIGDFQRLGRENIGFNDGIHYIHYLPRKTQKEGAIRKEVETPLLPFALEVINKYDFDFPIIHYPSGESGYNAKIRRIIELCGINRTVAVFNEQSGKNEYKPINVLASSKLARKTHIDLMNKVQINQYAAGLHRVGSDAVNRYTSLSLKDRYTLMLFAFSCENNQ